MLRAETEYTNHKEVDALARHHPKPCIRHSAVPVFLPNYEGL